MAQAPIAGSRWIRRNGKHVDTEVEVTSTNGLSVVFVDRVGGASMGNQKLDDREHSLAYEMFVRQYVAKDDLEPREHTGGRAFRQNNPPRPRAEATPPLSLNGVGLVKGMGLPFSIEVVDISPSMAQAWLDRGQDHNRLPTRGRIVRYSNAIRRGEWRLTGDTIKIDADGFVLDGRHRLLAVIMAGMPIRSLVIRGVETDTFTVLDTGKNRTPGDVMGIAGYKNRVAIASTARGLILIDASGRYDPGNRLEYDPLLTHAAQLRFAQDHPEVEQGVLLANQVKAAGLKGGAGLLGTLFALLIRADEEQAGVFAEKLGSGANLANDSPILRFRNRLIVDNRMSGAIADREHLLALGIKAWNLWRRSEGAQQLTWHPQRGPGTRGGEAFPVAE